MVDWYGTCLGQFNAYFELPYNLVECSYLESLLSMTHGHANPRDHQRAMDAQWQFTQQTYGDGFLQIFQAVSSYIGGRKNSVPIMQVEVIWVLRKDTDRRFPPLLAGTLPVPFDVVSRASNADSLMR